LDDYGEPQAYIDALYDIYLADFITDRPRFRGRPVSCKRIPYERGKDGTFWHITQQGTTEAERTMDLRRAERIRWVRAVIEHADDPSVKVWLEKKNSEDRFHLWLEAADFLVVLADRRSYILLWTAFYVERDHYRKGLQKRYLENQKS
jgi:hypothetical protein